MKLSNISLTHLSTCKSLSTRIYGENIF